ncbi:MAG: hypothetical protein LQ342_007861 [Letrouitia transgressa]|nr:MAG: hypothetical protein LQ342_007861 [Letrouitia transgressa]
MVPFKSLFPTITLLSTISLTFAQTWTSCDPTKRADCPADTALGLTHLFNLTSSTTDDDIWNTTAGTVNYGDDGAEFTINAKGDAPTIQSKFYLFFGEVEVHLRAATGVGVVSSVVLESDDLDEVDWELVGGNDTHAESNYFGKGNTSSYDRAVWHPIKNPQAEFHNYTTRWTKEKLEWFIDGESVRVLGFGEANGGKNYPQTPMNVRLGVWAGGDEGNDKDTIKWAGGETDYDKGPYTMFVKRVRVTDFSRGKEYRYGDTSGSWESIEIEPGNSTIADILTRPPPLSPSQRWNKLSPGAKIGIGSAVGATCVGLILLFAVYFFGQRRAGMKERAIADAGYEKETAELMAYRADMGSGGRWNAQSRTVI